MSTLISWTDETFSPVIGCTKISSGCTNCYSETMMDKRLGVVSWGPTGSRVVTSEENWNKQRSLNRRAIKNGVNIKLFCNPSGDVFEDWSGPMLNHKGQPLRKLANGTLVSGVGGVLRNDFPVTMDDVRNRLFQLIDDTPNLSWQLLTKRPENIRRMWPRYYYDACETGDCPHWCKDECSEILHRENVWLGTTTENQEMADKRIPELLKCSHLSSTLFLSMEPLLSAVDLEWPDSINPARMCCSGFDCGCQGLPTDPPLLNYIQWVIVGCESGGHRRETKLEWVRNLRDQCNRWRVPFFVKQLEIDGKVTTDLELFPEDLRIREFPIA